MFETNDQRIVLKRPGSSRDLDVYAAPEPRLVPHQKQTVGDLWRTFLKHKTLILSFAGVVFLCVAVYTFSKTPVYEGVARLQIDPTRSSSLGLDEAEKLADADVDSRVKTEVEIIQSGTVATRVMNSLGLYANPAFAHKDTVKTAGITNFSQLSSSQQRRLLERFSEDLLVRVIPNTQVVEIRFRSTDPTLAATTANSIINEYMQRNFQTRVNGTSQISQWLSSQMEDIQAATAASQQQLANFQRENDLLGADESDNIVTDRLKQLNEELTQAEADRIVKEGRYRLALSGNPELIASAVPDTTLQVLRTQQADLQAQYSELSSKFGDGYPKLREISSQLASIDGEISNEGRNIAVRLANEYNAAAKSEGMIRNEFQKQKTEAFKLNENVSRYLILKHQVESGQHLYDTLQLKLKEADVSSGLNSSYISIVDHAEQPDKPVEPRKLLNLSLGLGGGLLGGLILGLIADSMDDTIQNSDGLEEVVALPELGSIPFLSVSNSSSRRALNGFGKRLPILGFRPISLMEPECQGAEAYRALCSVLLLSSMDNPPKVLVVTSAMAGEGKSTISSNLATVLARRGRRVLLVDADLRCSSLSSQTEQIPGLSTMLTNPEAPTAGYLPSAELPNLRVIPAGARLAGTTEILASSRMQELLEIWGADYDHIIIDTPPVLPFSDGLLLASIADAVILVTRSGISRNRALVRARDMLSRSGANILGFVLNAVRNPEYIYAYPAGYQQPGNSKDRRDKSRKMADQAKNTAKILQKGILCFILILLGSARVAAQNPVQPVAKTPAAPAAYALKISAGDLLDVKVFETPDLSAKLRVDEHGNISLPLGGTVMVSGLTAEQSSDAIEKRLRENKILKDPHVSVTVLEYATQGVAVLGEVKNPGVYPLLGAHGLLDLISSAGGTTPNAGRTVTITHRDDPDHPVITKIDNGPGNATAYKVDVRPGDTIMVSHAGIVYVVGDVGKPGGFLLEKSDQLTVLQAVALAQGANRTASLNQARLIRVVDSQRREMQVPLKKILANKAADEPLTDGDILFVPSSGPKTALKDVENILPSAAGAAIYRAP
jgi:capsular exopolysaccharide synthesis family protein